MEIIIEKATDEHIHFVEQILTIIENAAKIRGTGIAKRSPDYLKEKFREGKGIIAHIQNKIFVGFCYIETWDDAKYVANSGLIVKDDFRGIEIAKKIKKAAFDLSRERYPDAKIFGLTTGLAVMKINSSLGYVPVTFSEITDDDKFWKGCENCCNYDILLRTGRKHCLCTGMLFDPNKKQEITNNLDVHQRETSNNSKEIRSWGVYGRWFSFKRHILLDKSKLKNQK